ncbi:MAG: class I mannose-6-phosphate isomerase [Acidimicrobiales bacterium]|nr:class I mannose-6-phosphate isomerase [Acidimicrobiales bacterium]
MADPARRRSTYDKQPFIGVPGGAGRCVAGWEAAGARLRAHVDTRGARRAVVVVDCYVGTHEREIRAALDTALTPVLTVDPGAALRPEAEIEALAAPYLGGDDPLFGTLSDLELPQLFSPQALAALRHRVEAVTEGIVLVVGCGARLVHPGDVVVYADLARWQAQQRQRAHEIPALGVDNRALEPNLQLKRAYFVDWRVCDRWKLACWEGLDFLLDTNRPGDPRLVEAAALRAGLDHAARRPFRLVPFFDPGPWGGHWMEEVCDLPRDAPNHAWCFDCVPEENSLVLGFGPHRVEIPALDLVLTRPRELLGPDVHGRFGAEFPIRFDFLDTMGGGNLSLQVHPLTAYAREHFGLRYTQDESYYLLDAAGDASVYLGVRTGVDRGEMVAALRAAQAGGPPFDVERYVNRWPARRHDHFLIPAGTVHCSGAGSMVLEISSTPYLFTFKLWDWGRLGLDGRPRPINIDRGVANIQWHRDTEWVRGQLVNRIEPLGEGTGWRAERTGLHERELLETVRHWFTDAVPLDTLDTVRVVNLVQGEEVVVESPADAFEPFVVHYAETFVVPAAVGPYTVRPWGAAVRHECATITASVRPTGGASGPSTPRG